MNEAATADVGDVLETIFAVDEGDEVHLAVRNYEWTSPFEVVEIDHVEWDGATGRHWATRCVHVEGGYSSEFSVTAIEGDNCLELRNADGSVRGVLERFERVSSGPSTEDDTQLSEAPDVDLEEEAVDDAPEDTGDDVQEDQDITVDAIDEESDTEIVLPDDVQEDDVDELTSGGIELGELAEELDVHPNRARAIAYGLGFYSRVREVKYRGGL